MHPVLLALVSFFVFTGSAIAPIHADNALAASDSGKLALAAVEEIAPSYTVKLTSYNAVPWQTDSNPSVTASGVPSNPEVVAARSRDLAEELPFGTVIKVTRTAPDAGSCGFGAVEHLVGYRVVADTMNARMVNKLDVELDHRDTVVHNGRAYNPSIVLGICDNVTVTVVGHLELHQVPATQAELAGMFDKNVLARN